MPIIARHEADWCKLGTLDPYYGVFSSDCFKTDNLTAAKKDDMFASGVHHIQICFAILDRVFNWQPEGTALDFGGGVGRVTCAMSPYFTQVVGVDISPGMLMEARDEGHKRGFHNILYTLSTEDSVWASEIYDFVHSYIVLQHIPTRAGERIIAKLITSLKVGGAGALHITYGTSRFREAVKKFLPLRGVVNLLRRRPWHYPTMQMNSYRLSKIFDIFASRGVNEFYVSRIDDSGTPGLFIFFRRPATAKALSPWSNPVQRVQKKAVLDKSGLASVSWGFDSEQDFREALAEAANNARGTHND